MLLPTYYHRDISDELVRDLHLRVKRGESVVVLGGKGVGKRYVIDLLDARRTEDGLPPLCRAEFAGEKLMMREDEVACELARSCGWPDREIHTLERWKIAVQEQAQAQNTPIYLAAANVDGMSKGLAHRFLTHVYTLVKDDERALVVVLTGEGNLIDLVDGGPTSAWTCAHQYVVHAHDEHHFQLFLDKRMKQFQLRFPADQEQAAAIFKKICEFTGRDVTSLRAVLWSLTDKENYHLKSPASLPVEIGLADIPERLTAEHVVAAGGVSPFQLVVKSLEAAAYEAYDSRPASNAPQIELLGTLRSLLKGEEIVLHTGRPHILELTGLARRTEADQLVFFSRYSEQFTRLHFTDQRFGDFYALAHDWANAHHCYSRCSIEERQRPHSEEDHLMLMRIADAVAIHFHSVVGELNPSSETGQFQHTLVKLREELRRLMKHLLGIEPAQMVSWYVDTRGIWRKRASESTGSLPGATRHNWEHLHRRTSGLKENELWGNDLDGLQWVICRDSQGRASTAVAVDGHENSLRDHPLRQSVIFRILRGYRRARERLSVIEGLREETSHRNAEVEISRTFWQLANTKEWVKKKALLEIASIVVSRLRSVRRLIFVVNNSSNPGNGRRFDIICDSSAPELGQHFSSFVVSEEVFQKRTNARHPAVIAKEISNGYIAHTGLAPLQDDCAVFRNSFAGGFIGVEAREGGFLPCDLDFLAQLSHTLAALWNQAFRLALMRDSLDALKMPTLLLDGHRSIVFANQVATKKLGLEDLEEGWQEDPVDIHKFTSDPDLLAALTPDANEGVRLYSNLTKEMRGSWLCESHGIENLQGSLIIFRNRAFLFGLFNLMRKIVACTSQAEALHLISLNLNDLLFIDSTKLRVYVIDPVMPGHLTSHRSYGFKNKENTAHFDAGGVRYNKWTISNCWTCLDSRKPEVFRMVSDPAEHHLRHLHTGLEYVPTVRGEQDAVLEKEEGDIWIDLPLLSGQRDPIGKLTLSFSQDDADKLTPDLPIIFGALALLLSALLERMQRDEDHDADIKRRADRAMTETAHTMVKEITVVSALAARYRLHESRLPALKAITDELNDFFEEARKSLNRIKDRAGEPVLRRERTDLVARIRSGLTTVLEADQWKLTAPPSVEADWDPDHWKNVIIEMAYNSREFARQGVPLQVDVMIRQDDAPAGWSLEIVYTDNGRGIPPQFKDVIFFGESHREGMGPASGGLGMSYARKVIVAHGGTIHADIEYEQGARFVIRLPVHPIPAPLQIKIS